MSSKACLYNLLVVSNKDEQLKKVEPHLDLLLSHFPGRLITLVNKEGNKNLSFKELPSIPLLKSKALTEARITIEVSGYEEDKVALLPLPYLIPDFPILLFWISESFDGTLFKTFYPLSKRLLLDSEEATTFKDHLKSLDYFAEQSTPVVDVSWSQGVGWRSIFREVYVSEHRKKSFENCHLFKISFVEGSLSNPLFFQAWIATAFGWSFKSRKDEHLYYEKEGKEIEVQLLPQKGKEFRPGTILNLEFESFEGEQCLIYQGDDALEVKVQICVKGACDLPFTLYLPNPQRGGAHHLSSWIWGSTNSEMLETLPNLKKCL